MLLVDDIDNFATAPFVVILGIMHIIINLCKPNAYLDIYT